MAGFGFGIIGCGTIAPFHADAIAASPDGRLVAVCDIVEEKLNAFGEKYGIPPEARYDDHRKMLERDDIDIVSICTPSGLHADMGIACANAGKHILSEKPIDINLAKIDAMIAAAAKSHVKLGCIFQRRTYDTSHEVREAVQTGRLGGMVLGDAYLKYFRSQEYYDSGEWRGTWALDGGGALMNQGVHGIDLLLWIMGPVKRVTARCDHLARDIEVEDTAVALLEYESGAFGVIEGTTSVHPGLPTRHEIHGEKGTIILQERNIVKWDIIGEEREAPSEKSDAAPSAHADPTQIATSGHIRQVQDIMDAVRDDRDPMVPGQEARKAVELILAIYKSSDTRQPVQLPLDA